MAFIKALIPGFIAAWLMSTIVGSQGSRGGVMMIEHSYIDGHSFYWSWPVFLAITLLGWAIFAMMD